MCVKNDRMSILNTLGCPAFSLNPRSFHLAAGANHTMRLIHPTIFLGGSIHNDIHGIGTQALF